MYVRYDALRKLISFWLCDEDMTETVTNIVQLNSIEIKKILQDINLFELHKGGASYDWFEAFMYLSSLILSLESPPSHDQERNRALLWCQGSYKK